MICGKLKMVTRIRRLRWYQIIKFRVTAQGPRRLRRRFRCPSIYLFRPFVFKAIFSERKLPLAKFQKAKTSWYRWNYYGLALSWSPAQTGWLNSTVSWAFSSHGKTLWASVDRLYTSLHDAAILPLSATTNELLPVPVGVASVRSRDQRRRAW